MLTLNHINKTFSSKVIFDDTQFIANPNELTVLIGPSGAGKTTLFNIILNIENCDYTFNNDNISDLDKKEKEQFILDNISYASQKPTFIADLKMNDQIALLKQIYDNDYDVSELINLFELDKLLDCYPNQLSGGEKSRFAFILALLKPARIYMFDEPTSALDDLQASHIVSVLNDLKEEGNIVIISTHDHRLIEQGDKVYKIENKQLNVIRKNKDNKQSNLTKTLKKYHLNGLNKYWLKMKEHHKFYNSCMTLLVTFGIVVSMCGIEYGYLVKNKFNSMVNNKESNLLIIYKEPSRTSMYDNSEYGNPFTENEYKNIESIKHINNYYYHLDYTITDHSLSPSYENNKPSILESDSTQKNIKISLNGKENEMHFLQNDEESDPGNFMTYPNEIDFSDKIKESWNNEGLYITFNFYEKYVKDMIKSEEDKKDILIEFPLFVPQYTGIGLITKGNFLANLYAGLYVNTKFHIKGILHPNVDSIIERGNFTVSPYSFALSNNEMQKYIDKYKVNDYWDCVYMMKEYRPVCGEKSKNIELSRDTGPVKYEPWQPNTFVVEVDDYKNLKSVKKELENKGFNVYSKYLDTNDYVTTENAMRDSVLLFSCTTFVIILFINLFLKLNNKIDEMSFTLYFKEKGFTKKMVKSMNNQRFFLNMINCIVVSTLMYVVLSVILASTLHIYLFVELQGIAIGLILIILIEYIIPMCLERYYSKEETSC